MEDLKRLLLTGLVLVLFCLYCKGDDVVLLNKVLVDHSGNLVNPKPGVKPTSKPVEHSPGVPPPGSGGSSGVQPQRPQRPINNNPFGWWASLFGGRAPSNETSQNNGTRITNVTVIKDDVVLPEDMVIKLNKSDVELLNATLFNGTLQSEHIIMSHNNLSYGILGSNSGPDPNKGIIDWIVGLVSGNNNNNNGGHGGGNGQKPPGAPKLCNHNCRCGIAYKHTRIVGGIETQVNAYPWMTILMYNNRFYCGASVINSKYLLTATHCVNGFTKERLKAVFLEHDRKNPSETKTFSRKITAVLKHKGYNQGGSYNNDISLLRLDEELPFNGLLKPVCLPATGKSFTGHKGIVTGWGATKEQGQVSDRLMEVEVPIMSNVECRKTGYSIKITDNMMCAGYKQGGKDSCQGDSGGPLHVVNKTQHSIVGIVSWGEGCAEPNYPGVYTRVNRYITWIRSNTKDACYCN